MDKETNAILAVEFSPEEVADALTKCEQETRQWRPPLVRNQWRTNKRGDMEVWQYNGPALPLLKVDKDGIPQVSAWIENI